MLSDFSRSTETVYGVWFLDEESLRGLDILLREQVGKLKKKRKNDIDRETRRREKHLRELYPNDNQTFQVKLEAAKQSAKKSHKGESIEIAISDEQRQLMKCATFAEAIESQALTKDVPTKFQAVVQVGQNKVEMTLGQSFMSGDQIVARVPPDDPHCKSVSDSIRHWAENCRQPRILCRWNQNSFLLFMFALFGAWVLFALLLQTKTVTPGADKLRAAAKDILEIGVNDNNRNDALSLLLQISLGEAPKRELVFSPWLSVPLFFSSLVLVFVIERQPRSILGIGKGKAAMASRISWYAFWTKFLPYILIICPSLAILQAVLGNWAYDQLRGMWLQ